MAPEIKTGRAARSLSPGVLFGVVRRPCACRDAARPGGAAGRDRDRSAAGGTEHYKAALRERIEAAVRLEPGVLTLYAMSVKDHPEQIRVLEVYASPAAYQAHLETPHFKKYKSTTQGWCDL